MKQHLTWNLVAIMAFSASAAFAGNVGVDVNVHLGDQPRPVIVREPVAPPPPPMPLPPPPQQVIRIDEDVNFIYPEGLGFYVAVGVPYDLFYVQNSYYVFRDGTWFRAPRSQGPWFAVRHRELPPGLRKHEIERIRAYRNAEYASYRRDREHYHGRHFKSGKEEWKQARKEEKEYRKEEKRAEKEERKAEKEERKHHGGRDHDRD